MTTRFPLFAKILLWFFLNIVILGVAAAVLVAIQIKSGAELLVTTLGGPRLQAVSTLVREELVARPRQDWNDILARVATAYHVEMFLFRNDGGQLAGDRVALPLPVEQRLIEPRRVPRGGRPEPEFPPGPPPEPFAGPPGRFDGPPAGAPERDLPPGPEDRFPERGGRPEARDRRAAPMPPATVRFVVRTDDPRAYWIGLPMPVLDAGERPAMRSTLLLRSKSLNPGGLLLDVSVWVWAVVAAALFSALFWLPLVRSITRTVSQMKAAAAGIAEGRFDVRVSERRSDELGALGAGINQMASRLNGFVTGQKRFLGDIAHELCSPIARMQMALGILEERADEKAKPYVEDVKEEVQQMSTLVNELLSFSKASLGSTNIRLQPVELRPLAERAVKREAREGSVIQNTVEEGVCVMADPELVVRALSNLLRNSIRYAGDAGTITVESHSADGMVEIAVCDNGPGVPEQELPKLFDPFYRVDASRARETGGAGLGLAIVKTCIESCHGTVRCRNRNPGLEVTMILPQCTSAP